MELLDKFAALRHCSRMHHHLSPKKIILSSSKWIISLGMLYYVLHSIDMDEVFDMLKNQNPVIPALVIVLMLVQMLTSTSRWQRVIYVLCGKTLTTRYSQLAKLNMISMFFNSCLPGTIGGDVVRAMLLRRENIAITLCAHSVIIDRLMAMFGVYFMATASLPFLGMLIPSLNVPLLLAASVIAMIIAMIFLERAPKFLEKFPHNHLTTLTRDLLKNIHLLVFSPKEFTVVLLMAILSHGYFCMGVYLIAASLGTPLTPAESLLLIPPVILLTMLPISVGGWGVREVSMVGFLALVGVPKEAALTISVQFGLLLILASLPGAWYYATLRKPEAVENAAGQS